MTQIVKNLPAMQETWFDPWVGKTSLEEGDLGTYLTCTWEYPEGARAALLG
mgnify:CR=1 FL=1